MDSAPTSIFFSNRARMRGVPYSKRTTITEESTPFVQTEIQNSFFCLYLIFRIDKSCSLPGTVT